MLSNIEGSTLNDLRRLLEEERTARAAYYTCYNRRLAGADDTGVDLKKLDEAAGWAMLRLRNAAVQALPALLDRLEAAERVAVAAENYVSLSASLEELEEAVRAHREQAKAGPS